MFELLLQKFSEQISLTEEEKERVRGFFTPRKLRKRQYFVQEGDVAKYVAFVEAGILRSYSIDEKGGEHIIQFAFPGWWISDQYSFLTGEPATLTIDVLEDAQLLLISHQAQEELLRAVPMMERYFRILLQNSMIASQRRLASSMSESAEVRYNRLMQSQPDIARRIPQRMIASYLGITPETLSRIRKQMAERK